MLFTFSFCFPLLHFFFFCLPPPDLAGLDDGGGAAFFGAMMSDESGGERTAAEEGLKKRGSVRIYGSMGFNLVVLLGRLLCHDGNLIGLGKAHLEVLGFD